MSIFRSRPLQLLVVLFLAAVGAIAGAIAGSRLERPEATKTYPLPHHVPKYPGVASLRFAMVHDVVTERFAKHGPAYYEERNRIARAALDQEEARMKQGDGKPTARYFELVDDLAAGLDLLGQHDQSVALMRRKLKQQQELALPRPQVYSTYANLGTFIILQQIHEGFADKAQAKARLTEGVGLIHEAININPQSHFGREIWQAVILEYLIAWLDNPDLVLKYDMVGNSLPLLGDEVLGAARTRRPGWSHMGRQAHEFLKNEEGGDVDAQRARYREFIARVGAEPGWTDAVKTRHQSPVPFDEPTLGIIGMWRLGGGPNPFFAIALAETMLRVGQQYTAWNAYERAYRLGDGLGEKFKEHCRARQKFIEGRMSPEDVPQLRPSFERHLQKGQAYQKAYQDYEARRIREGASIADPHFYDAFFAEHGSIASPIGDEDKYPADPEFFPRSFKLILPIACLGAGLFALSGALLFCLIDRRPRSAVAETTN
ncbi:MAG: hypothetical protein JNM56_07650 [Planctomycetia bacterium]|nr:hypothetical protein [Planctomycetia bacterium]